jgi:hypothetical protein
LNLSIAGFLLYRVAARGRAGPNRSSALVET